MGKGCDPKETTIESVCFGDLGIVCWFYQVISANSAGFLHPIAALRNRELVCCLQCDAFRYPE